MGWNEATSETHANRQWEIHTASIRSIQDPAEGLLSRFFGLVLQSQGIAAAVKIKFSELGASEELRDEQVQATRRLCCSVISMIRPPCLCHLKRRCLRVALSFTLLRVNQHVVAEAQLTGPAIQNKFRISP